MHLNKFYSIKNEEYRKIIYKTDNKNNAYPVNIDGSNNIIKLSNERMCMQINPDKTIRKRLFIATGLISLINSQAILQMIDNSNFENYLIIYSSTPNNSFEKYNKKLIIPDLFKNYEFRYDIKSDSYFKDIDTIDYINQFDEIYTTAQYNFKNIYKHKNINLIEEGISSYFSFNNIIQKNVKNIYLSNYFNLKHQDKTCLQKVKQIDKKLVLEMIEKIRKQNNIDFSYLKKDNQVLLLSQYIYQYIMNKEDIVAFYKKHIDILIKGGYSVLFKSHPRMADDVNKKLEELYKDNTHFSVFPEEIKYPVEIIIPDLSLRAIVSSMSGGAFNSSYIFDIPCYGFGAKLMNHPSEHIMKYRQIFLDYMPHVSEFIPDYKWQKLNVLLKIDQIPKFTQIRLETTNNCRYKCFMCPRQKMTRKIGKMSMDDLSYVIDCLDFIKYELDFHLHGYGDALICDDLPERCELITSRKKNFTPLIYTTLGYEKTPEWFERLFEKGLGKVVVSLYGYDKETYKAVHGVDKFELVKKNLELLAQLKWKYGFKLSVCIDDFKNKYPLPKHYNIKKVTKLKRNFIEYLHNLGITDITGQILHDFGDGFSDLGNLDKTVPCSVCYGNRRQHLSISWDLNINPCAYDYDGTVNWGNLKEKSLKEIYSSDELLDFIKSFFKLNNKIYPICSKDSCFPNEGQHEKEYKIVKKFMEEK